MSGWRHIRFGLLGRLVEEVEPRLRWKWRKAVRGGRPRLQLVSPRGVAWDFKLSGGSWIRKAELDLDESGT